MLDIPIGTARSRLHYAIGALRSATRPTTSQRRTEAWHGEDLQTTDALRSWLADAEHPRSTGPVVDAVLGSIGSIRQEPASSVRNAPRRYAWVSLAAAAAVVVAIGVSLLRPEPATGRGRPSASPPRPQRGPPPGAARQIRLKACRSSGAAQMIDVPGSSHA